MAPGPTVNGVLAVPASLTSKKANPNSPTPKLSPRPSFPRLRVITRRLPPGLTLTEFENTLSNEWRAGAGKVDWFAYREGKVSKDPSKPSRPARAYLRVKDQNTLDSLAVVVKQSIFQDAKNTSRDSCLLGPPLLEFAPYGRIPSSRVRKDGRQGTIDQDPEFIDFLQSLTEPVTKPGLNGESGEAADVKVAKVTTTPLVEYLKEKKANKGKESAASKPSKSQAKAESKEAKPEKTDAKRMSVVQKETLQPAEKVKVEKASPGPVKVANRSVAGLKGKPEAPPSCSPSPKASPVHPAPVKRERERPSARAAAKILQRDLGLAPARGDSRVSRGATTASKAPVVDADSKATPPAVLNKVVEKAAEHSTSDLPAQPDASTPTFPSAPPVGPRIGKTSSSTSQPISRAVATTPIRSSRPPPSPSAGARSAFLKHANFSQGVTEELLRTTFSGFGVVTRCEVDRKKGFAYVDFEDTESLKKAMLTSPVKVGSKGGQVVVLENKNLKMRPQTPLQPANLDQERAKTELQTAPVAPAKAEKPVESPAASVVPSTPTSPRGSHSGYRGTQHQGARGGYSGPLRGGFGRGARVGRASFRGRGTYDNRGGGPAKTKSTSDSDATAPLPTSKQDADAKTDTRAD